MRKKKVITLRPYNILDTEHIKISKCKGEDYFFEIGNNITQDIIEAVVLMMRDGIDDYNPSWNTEISDVSTYEIDPKKSLYWLTGGDDEWIYGKNYKYPWHECVNEFTENFGEEIIEIIESSNTLADVKFQIINKLNLPILFEFALQKKIA
jgi:hypothetical protein